MDIGRGLERLAELGALIVLGSVFATLCLMIGVTALAGYVADRLRRRTRLPGPDDPEG